MTGLELHDFLKSIYHCESEFELYLSNRTTKKRLGTYFIRKKRINLYLPLIRLTGSDIREVAIHEYAHHIHRTELQDPDVYERPHGPEFWRIYSALMAKAELKNIYSDEYITPIIKQ